ncbi:MAG: site-specific DNA-methyltransferase [Ureaplasma sp.]|nr:site-specific DNA-methyltransferase [Ureaplasma sp.]
MFNNNDNSTLDRNELFNKLSKLSIDDLKKINITPKEINFLKSKILNHKLGLSLNFEEKDEFLDNNYFGLEEITKLNINAKDKNNNLLIEGDNYCALKSLLVSGIKVDVIYIDPPYNTGNNDFVYNDSFVNKDDEFKHSKWLSFMKKRLELAKELLSDDGIIFVSIDDNEQAYLKVLMDEIFGENNFISDIIWIRNPGGESDNLHIAKTKDFILFYSKNKNKFQINYLKDEISIIGLKNNNGELYKKGPMLEKSGENDRLIDRPNLGYIIYFNPKENKVITSSNYKKDLINDNLTLSTKIYEYDENLLNKGYIPIIPRYTKGTYGRWRQSEETFNKELINNKYIFQKTKNNEIKIYSKEIFNSDNPYKNLKPKDFISFTTNSFGTNELKKIFNGICVFSKPKPSNLISYLLNLHTNKNSIVLDFFAGSGTTAQAVMELNEEDGGNRRFILCTNNENNIAINICRERIYRVINGVGSNNEKIDWQYSEDKKSLSNNSMKHLRVKPIHKYDGNYEEINEMKEIYKKEFNKELNIKDFK